MTRRTDQDAARRRALSEDAAGWPPGCPRRGDIAYDTNADRVGVVVATPADTGTELYNLRPEGGGHEWTAPRSVLRPHPGEAPDGLTLDEVARPPHDA